MVSDEAKKLSQQDLANVYRHVDDIDLFSGGLLETPLANAIVGPTFGCIIGLQFEKLKKCDRFWFETPNPEVGFTPEQLRQIKNETAAKIFCRNGDSPFHIQRFAFDLEDEKTNPRINCSDLSHIDLMFWREDVEVSLL
jgi:peroxidase